MSRAASGYSIARRGFATPLFAALVGLAILCAPHRLVAVQGDNGAVASEHILASRAGVTVLERGGNAVDAAVATAFAVCVVNPSSCGIGGGGFMVIYLADEKRALALDYRETAPAAATRDMFVRDGKVAPNLSLRGGLAVAVPGEVRGMAEALAKHGTLSLAHALAPAIRLAKGGFPAGTHLAAAIADQQVAIAAIPALAANLLRHDGSPKRVGDKVAFPELGHTLERIAAAGADAFYEGEIAEQIAAAVQAAGGIMTATDLAAYRPRWREALAVDFAGHRIFTMPPPSSAGVALQVLGILRDDKHGDWDRSTADYLHLLAESAKHGFADRARVYGDPDATAVPIDKLLAAESLATLRQRIAAESVAAVGAYGTFANDAPAGAGDDHGTSHLSVIDKRGNAVACTTTINTSFGSLVIAGTTGILLNNEMDDFSAQPGVANVFGLIGAEANAVAPGKRPLSSMAPTIATKDGTAVLAVGGSGGPRILSGTLQVLLNTLIFGLTAEDAVAAPRIHHQWQPHVLAHEPGIPARTRRLLRRKGHELVEVAHIGAVQAVRRTERGFEGASDPRKDGEAAAW